MKECIYCGKDITNPYNSKKRTSFCSSKKNSATGEMEYFYHGVGVLAEYNKRTDSVWNNPPEFGTIDETLPDELRVAI